MERRRMVVVSLLVGGVVLAGITSLGIGGIAQDPAPDRAPSATGTPTPEQSSSGRPLTTATATPPQTPTETPDAPPDQNATATPPQTPTETPDTPPDQDTTVSPTSPDAGSSTATTAPTDRQNGGSGGSGETGGPGPVPTDTPVDDDSTANVTGDTNGGVN